MSVEIQRLQGAKNTDDTATITTAGVRKMQRIVHFTSEARARFHALTAALQGEKIGIMCGSKSAAEALAKCFTSAEDVRLNVGVYTSDKKVRGDVNELWKHHDVIIFTSVYTTGADFQLPVVRVFVMPKVGVATAREMMQGGRRFRNVTSGEIVIGVEARAEAACPITRRELNARYQVEVAALGRLRELRMRSMRIAECAGVGTLDMEMVCPVDHVPVTSDMLVMAAAYDRAERHFSSKMELL
jgi:Origin of replication binding protein